MRDDSGEENARGHGEGQRDDVRCVFEHGTGTWDKRIRGDAICGRLNAHAVTHSTDSYRYAAPEHEVSRKCDQGVD